MKVTNNNSCCFSGATRSRNLTTATRRASDPLPSDTHHGAEALGAQKRACVTSAAAVFAPQHASHALVGLCNFTGPPVSRARTHTRTGPLTRRHTLDTPTPPHHRLPGHCFPSRSPRNLTDRPPGGSPLPLRLDWFGSPGNRRVRPASASTAGREAPVQNKKAWV